MNQIFAQLFYEMEKHRDTVLVTLIDAAGSAPRKSGSQMLVGANGRLTGTIGGGAVELEAEGDLVADGFLADLAVGVLEERRGVPGDVRYGRASGVQAGYEHAPAIRLEQAVDELGEGGLAGVHVGEDAHD